MVDIAGTTDQVLECLCGFGSRSYGRQCRTRYVVDDEESTAAECCFELLINMHIKHPIGQVLLDCVSSFHGRFGCSVRTLLCMILVWYRTYSSLLRQDVPELEIYSSCDELLSVCISTLKGLASDVRCLFKLVDVDSAYREFSTNQSLVEAKLDISNDDHSRTMPSKLFTSTVPQVDATQTVINEPGDFDDVSWFFAPDKSNFTKSIVDNPIASVQSLQSVKVSSPLSASVNNHVHSDDEDFADCFDSFEEPTATKTESSKLNSIDWLNQALASMSSKSSTPSNDPRKASNIYSHNLSTTRTGISNRPCHKTANSMITKSSSPSSEAQNSASYHLIHNNLGSLSEDGNLNLRVEDNNLTVPSKSQSTMHSDVITSIEDLLEGISRADNCVATLLSKVVDHLSSSGEVLSAAELDKVTLVRCAGPLSSRSDVCRGIVVNCDSDVVRIVSGRSVSRTLLFQGDLHANYHHTGYKKPVRFRKVIKPADLVTEAKMDGWTEQTFKAIIQSGVQCLLMKGVCELTLKNNLLSRGVIVIERVSYSALSFISEYSGIPILHYSTDISQAYCCDLDFSRLDMLSHAKTVNNLLTINFVKSTDSSQAAAISVILCSPVTEETHIIEERLRHALSRLKHILTSGYCLINLSLDAIITQLYQNKDVWSSNSLLAVVAEQFIQELSSLITYDKSTVQTLHIDDLDSVVGAWETSLSAVKYLSSIKYLVRTGA